MVPEKNGLRKNSPREKWSLENWSQGKWSQGKWSPEKWSREKWSPENWSPRKMIPGKLVPGKMVLGRMSFKNCSPSKECYKIWTTFLFLSFNPLHTQKRCLMFTSQSYMHQTPSNTKGVRRLSHDFSFPSFGFVVEFWVFIDWSHPNIPHIHTHTHTHTTMLDAHPMIFSGPILPGTIFPRTNFPGTIFPGTIFPGDHFIGYHFSRWSFFRDSFSFWTNFVQTKTIWKFQIHLEILKSENFSYSVLKLYFS